MYNIKGKTVLITGAATGIGREIANRFGQEGCDIGIFDINLDEAGKTASAIEKAGQRCIVYDVDVGDFDAVKNSVAQFIVDFGKIDILVNNAGIIEIGTVIESSIEAWRRVFRINVEGVFNLCKAVAPHLVERKSGKIINTASWLGKSGVAQYGAYCSSKFAVIGLTQTLAVELAPAGINVNAICPGTIVETGMRTLADQRSVEQGLPTAKEREGAIPLGRVGLPRDIARVVAFLASEEADYMTGQAINITGGLWRN